MMATYSSWGLFNYFSGNPPEIADKNNDGDTGTEKPWLTVSDWVTFLSNEKQGNISSFLNFTALLVALLGLTYVTEHEGKGWWNILDFLAVVVVLILVYFKVGNFFNRTYNDAQDILKRIISGELKEEKAIRKAWEAKQH